MISNFQGNIEKIYDHLYANFSSKTPSAIGDEVGKILHTALYLEEHKKIIPAFNFNRVDSSALLNGDVSLRREYADSVRHTFTEMNKKWEIYDKNEKIILDDYDLCYCCIYLSGIEISNKNKDIFGDAVEVFRGEWAKHIGGQFFTDPQVTKLAVNLLDFDPRNGDDLVDICAGTGGFLLAGLNRIQHLSTSEDRSQNDERQVVKLALNSLKGLELDPEVCAVANSTLKTRLGKATGDLVKTGNSLLVETFKSHNSVIRENSHRCVATNPPFGTKITIKDPEILKHFELALRERGINRIFVPTAPDILFLEQNVRLLIPGKGRLAIVLPYQLLSGPQTLDIRKWLLLNTKIIAIVDLPIETFQPYTGTKTSLVVVERKKSVETSLSDSEDYKIFMAIPRWIGHDRRGIPIYKKDDGSVLSDFDDVISAFAAYKRGTDPNKIYDGSFTINFKSIRNDLLLRINSRFWRPASSSNDHSSTLFKKSDWKTVKLKDLVKRIFYPGRFKRNYVNHGPSSVPFLGGADINEFITRTHKWLAADDPRLEELKVYRGWVLITRSGTTGIVSSVPEAWDGYAVSEHVIRIIPDDSKLESEYVLAVLQSKYIQEILVKGIYGSVIDEINPDYIGDIDIPIPTSKRKYEKIIQMLNEAEKHRHLGIVNYMEAIDTMNQMLSI